MPKIKKVKTEEEEEVKKPKLPKEPEYNPVQVTVDRITELRGLYETLAREGITSISNLEAKIQAEELRLSQLK